MDFNYDENKTIMNDDMLSAVNIIIPAGTICGFAANASIYGMTFGTLMCAAFSFTYIILSLLGFIFKRHKTAFTYISIGVLVLGQFPFLFYEYGLAVVMYLLLGIVATSIFLPKRYRLTSSVIVALFDVIVVIFTALHHPTENSLSDPHVMLSVTMTFLIAAAGVVSVITFLISRYNIQHRELLRVSREYEISSTLDPLTGAYNRRYLMNYVESLGAEISKVSVALIDIDNFKNINDTYGHSFGDEVIVKITSILKAYSPSESIVVRYGGEEFVVVFKSTSKEKIKKILDSAAAEFKAFSLKKKNTEFTFSGGIVECSNAENVFDMLNRVDKKMYEAKNCGKNCILY